jgi:hypothetical protein
VVEGSSSGEMKKKMKPVTYLLVLNMDFPAVTAKSARIATVQYAEAVVSELKESKA